MLFFRNDYGEGCIDTITQLLIQANNESHPGYGEDDYSRKAAEIIQSKLPDYPSDIHFIVSGTLTNIVMIRHVLKSYETILCCDTSHICQHEAGAIEISGHKILTVPNQNGKITAVMVRATVDYYSSMDNLYLVPKVVYISNATEMGTVYTRQELEDLSSVCKEKNLYLMCDGARIGPALMSGIDYSLNDMARWCDIFSVGGTKNGALFGEAVVIPNNDLKPYFRHVQKQSGAILAKGWLIAMQFIGLFEKDEFYKCAKHANDLALQIQEAMIRLGYPLFMRSTTNQIFFVLEPEQYDFLHDKVGFEVWDKWEDQIIIRIVTSWHTTQEDTDALIALLKEAIDLTHPNLLENEENAEEEDEEEEETQSAATAKSVTPQESGSQVF